ncbi:MAG: PolC-type DNA polymerase III [Alphaproteobacteria bacterium]
MCALAAVLGFWPELEWESAPVLAAFSGLVGGALLLRARVLALRGDARPEYVGELSAELVTSARGISRGLEHTRFVVFDTETTGLRPRMGDAIVSIGAVALDGRQILMEQKFDELVDPGRKIPSASTRIHGITDDMVVGKRPAASAIADFHGFCEGAVLVAHNAAFDLAFIAAMEHASAVHFSNPILDTMQLSRHLHPREKDHSLDAIAIRYGIALEARHSAWGDALATAEIFARQIGELRDRNIMTLDDALKACGTVAALHRARAGSGDY